MTGLDCLREEMKARGCTDAMAKSKTAAVVLDILTNAGEKYTNMQETENKYERWEARLKERDRNLSEAWEWLKQREKEVNDKWREIYAAKEEFNKAVDEFNERLTHCETPEKRDALKTALFYINNVEINSKYDNTAYIIGLGAILSRGSISAIEELKKINKKFPVDSYISLGVR